MTEQERLERISKGKLWYDTDEYMAHQAKVKDLMYDFNMSKPSETGKRAGLIQKMFGSVEKVVFLERMLRSVQPVIRLILRNVPREVCIPFLL